MVITEIICVDFIPLEKVHLAQMCLFLSKLSKLFCVRPETDRKKVAGFHSSYIKAVISAPQRGLSDISGRQFIGLSESLKTIKG